MTDNQEHSSDPDREQDTTDPGFPTAIIELKIRKIVLENEGIKYGSLQRSRLSALAYTDIGSYVSFGGEHWSSFEDSLSDNSVVHIFGSHKPGIWGQYTRVDGTIWWDIIIAVSVEQFFYIQRHVTGFDPQTGERIRSRPMSDLIEIGGWHFEPVNPGFPTDPSFFGEVAYVRLGGWSV